MQHTSAFLLGLTAWMLPIAGSAQEAGGDGTDTMEEMTVTVQRRAQGEQDVGVALNAFSGDQLRNFGVETVNDLEYFSPNFEVESQFGSGQPGFSLRGVGLRDFATNNAPTVGVYVDDVAYPVPIMTQGAIFDIERVEILRGPQGTLYGRNTTGGAVKLLSRRPSDDLTAGLVLEGGRFGAFSAEGYLSGPVTDRVRLRLSAITRQGGDWQINEETGATLGDQDLFAGRLIADIDVSDRIRLTLNVHGFDDESDGLGLQLFNDSPLGFTAADDPRDTNFGSSPEFGELIGIETDQGPFRDSNGWGVNATLNAELGPVTLTYVGAFESLNRVEFNDFDATSLGASGTFFDSDVTVLSQELRLAGSDGDRLNWVAGVYYARERLDELFQSDFIDDPTSGPFVVTTPYSQDVDTIAGFLHADYALTDHWSIVAGIRFEDEERNLIDLGTFTQLTGTLNFANALDDGTLVDETTGFSEVTGNFAVEYRPTGSALIYASYRRGVKSGGFSAYNTLSPEQTEPFVQEELNAYEVGFKTDWLGGRLRINGAGFFYDYNNQQLQDAIFTVLPAFGIETAIGVIVNVGESEIYGGELEVTWQATDWLTIGQALGVQEGRFRDFTGVDLAASAAAGEEVLVDRSGDDLGLPLVSYQGYVAADIPLLGRYRGKARFDYSFRDETLPPLLALGGIDFTVDDFILANAQIGLYPQDGFWELTFWGRNIFNSDYDETRNFFIGPGTTLSNVAAAGQVATYGARLALKF